MYLLSQIDRSWQNKRFHHRGTELSAEEMHLQSQRDRVECRGDAPSITERQSWQNKRFHHRGTELSAEEMHLQSQRDRVGRVEMYRPSQRNRVGRVEMYRPSQRNRVECRGDVSAVTDRQELAE